MNNNTRRENPGLKVEEKTFKIYFNSSPAIR
jgi:hypothetical protein